MLFHLKPFKVNYLKSIDSYLMKSCLSETITQHLQSVLQTPFETCGWRRKSVALNVRQF